MTLHEEEYTALRSELASRGFSPEQIEVIIGALPVGTYQIVYRDSSASSIKELVTAIIKEPAVVDLLKTLASKEEKLTELDNKDEKEFQGFLTTLDRRQKIYNVIFMIVGCSIVALLKYLDIIGKESAQTLVTVVITSSLTDAISKFFKGKERD